ncbi:MAG TPA: hypothetical protein VL463_04010, partial [Kofleriaceae bacterium]|nr:hypothetical protein [Kofleriaceae bacterium]
MLRIAIVLVVLGACYQRDPQADSDALAEFGRVEAARQAAKKLPRSGPPLVLAALDKRARREALDGAWIVEMRDHSRIALDIHDDRATLVDARGDHDASVSWPLPCEVDLTITHGNSGEVYEFSVVPPDPPLDGLRIVQGDVAERWHDDWVACAYGSFYVLSDNGCTRWLHDGAGGWLHAPEDCSFITSLPIDGARRWS